jgi:protein SCO1
MGRGLDRVKNHVRQILTVVVASLWLGVSAYVHAAPHGTFSPKSEGMQNETPKQLENAGITERLGETVDLNLTFTNENGETVPLRSFIRDNKPVLLSLAYYNCPSLCNFHLNGVNDTLRQLKAPTGTEFNFVVVSIDPRETPELAKAKKEAYLKAYGRPEGADGWHFLVGSEEQIKALADQVGFGYQWDEEQQQYAHAAAAIALTPEGKISRYLYGIVFDPQTLRLSMLEASNGKVGTLVDKLILFCFHFDPKTNKYSLYAFNVMRAGGVMIMAVLAMFLVPFWFRSRREVREVKDLASDLSRANKSLQGEA